MPGVLCAFVLAAYPLLMWLGLSSGRPRATALVLFLVVVPAVLLRPGSRDGLRAFALVPLCTAAALGVSALLDSVGLMLFVPVAINVVLLVGFGVTLRRGAVPMIERFARLQESELSSPQQAWCRMWTRLWCAFFVLNAAAALLLALLAPVSWWALYNGGLAYLLIGGMFAVEWLLRPQRDRLQPALGEGERR